MASQVFNINFPQNKQEQKDYFSLATEDQILNLVWWKQDQGMFWTRFRVSNQYYMPAYQNQGK